MKKSSRSVAPRDDFFFLEIIAYYSKKSSTRHFLSGLHIIIEIGGLTSGRLWMHLK